MKKILNTLNNIHKQNSFSTRKNFKIEKINLLNFDIDNIEYGRKIRKINNKEVVIKSDEVLIHYIPEYIKENMTNKKYKKSIKKVLKDNKLILRFMTYQELITYTNFSIDIFINGLKKDISTLKFIFDNNYNLYIFIPNIAIIQNLYIFEKAVKSHSRYVKSGISNIPLPYSGINNYLLFIDGKNRTTYTISDNDSITSALTGSIIEIITFERNLMREPIPSGLTYYKINHPYEFDVSSLMIFSNGDHLDVELEQKTKNIIKFISDVAIDKVVFYPDITQIYHNEDNLITRYIELFGIEDLMAKLNNATLNLSLLEYLNSINTMNDNDAFNTSETMYRDLNHPTDTDPIDTAQYTEFINTSFKNILTDYNPNLYKLYLDQLLPKNKSILFNTNTYKNKKIIYKFDAVSEDISNWVDYQDGSVVISWFKNVRYLKRIINNYPSGSYRLFSESLVNYITTFNFVVTDDTSPKKLILSLVNSSFSGKSICLDMSTDNKSIGIQSIENGNLIAEPENIIPINFDFKTNKIYTLKMIKNINSYEIYLYDVELNEEASFSVKENIYFNKRISTVDEISYDRLFIQGSTDIMFNNFQIRNISIIDQSLPIRSSITVDTVPFTLTLPNINHIINTPSHVFTVQTNKNVEDSHVVTYIDGVRVSNSLQTTLLNYNEKYGIHNFLTLLIEKNIFVLQGKEKIEIEFLNRSEYITVAEYTYDSQEPSETSTVNVIKSLLEPVFLVDCNGDYILDSNGDYIVINQLGINVDNYRVYKNGRYMSRKCYTITEGIETNEFNLNFHIEYQDIITIEYTFYSYKEIYNISLIDPTGICKIIEHRYPLTVDYYDFYLNGRKLYLGQVVNLSKDTFYITGVHSLYNLDVVEKNISNNSAISDIDTIFGDTYTLDGDTIDTYFETKTPEEIATEIGHSEIIEEQEFDNIVYSYNALKTLYERLYDEYLISNIVNCSAQINSDLLETYQMLQNKDGYILIDANDYQAKYMPLDASVIIE